MHRFCAVCAVCIGMFVHHPVAQGIIVDHTSVGLFDQIPPAWVDSAAALRLMFRHASIGDALTQGLDCLQGTRDNPRACTVYPDYQYDRTNWDFQNRGNPSYLDKIRDFAAQVDSQAAGYDVLSFKYCFIDYAGEWNVGPRWDSLRVNMELLESRYPDKVFLWWTIPLTRTAGQADGESLNTLIRAYCRDNDKILFDIADIESHDSTGNPVADSAGLEIAWQPWCGEQQVGGMSCHPNWNGKLWIDQALWVMMARIAGWDGNPTAIRPPKPSVATGLIPTGTRYYDLTGRRIGPGFASSSPGLYLARDAHGTVRLILHL